MIIFTINVVNSFYYFMVKYFILFFIFTVTYANGFGQDKSQKRISTAQSNVIVLDKEFEITSLDRKRKVRIYLPKNYFSSKQKYSVVYMQDGQNLFDDSTSFVGEWKVDESLNQIGESHNLHLIVVGIDNGGAKRINEYSPWENPKYGKAEGEAYVEFIVKQLKPYIDKNYRTKPKRKDTAVMGSSMGALISHYAIYKYPRVFGKLGSLSSSYWYSDKVYSFTDKHPLPKESKLFLMVGKNEKSLVSDAEKMYKNILSSGHPVHNIKFEIDPDGNHSESSWSKQFVTVVQWLFLN